jgi:hypothetical protein
MVLPLAVVASNRLRLSRWETGCDPAGAHRVPRRGPPRRQVAQVADFMEKWRNK